MKYRFAVDSSLPDMRLIGTEHCPTLIEEARLVVEERRRTANEYFQSLSTTDNEHLNYAKTLYINTQDTGGNGGALVYLLTLSGCDDEKLSALTGALMMHSNLLMRFEDDLVDRDRESQTENPAADFLVQNLSVKIALFTLNTLCHLLPKNVGALASLFYHSQMAKLQAAEINDVSLKGKLVCFDDLLENLALKTGSQGELAGGLGAIVGFQGENEQVLEKGMSNVALALGILTNDLQDFIHDFINGLPNTIVGLAYDHASSRDRRWLRKAFGRGDFDSRLLKITEESQCIPRAIGMAQVWIEEASELLHSVNTNNTDSMNKIVHFVDKDITQLISACNSVASLR